MNHVHMLTFLCMRTRATTYIMHICWTMDSSETAAMETGPLCPVISGWRNSCSVMAQLLKDKLVVLQYPSLGRASLADNIDLLAPLISTVGFLV